MAFICNDCRETVLDERGVSKGYSKGACELCNYTDNCFDLTVYRCKENWQDIVKDNIKIYQGLK